MRLKTWLTRTYWTEGDVGTLPEEGEDDHLDGLADHGHDVGPPAVHQDLLLGESQEQQQQAVVRSQGRHQQPEVSSGPGNRIFIIKSSLSSKYNRYTFDYFFEQYTRSLIIRKG